MSALGFCILVAGIAIYLGLTDVADAIRSGHETGGRDD